MDLVEGMMAPEFSLPTDSGESLRLSELSGAVLFFYPKDNTPGCTKEAIAFSHLKEDFAKAGVTVIGISPDSVKKHQNFKAKQNLTVTLVADEEKAAAEAYGVWIEKSLYGRKYMGVDRSTFLIGKDGKIARIWRKVKVPGHAEAVLEAAQAL
ncbi:peroxiredoxin [Breoghania sp. L-A4]|uniref:peroxiredoxin n=1 Tax=Breoghania sp. L-A4 TaxID=2304600 RepID=UPI000E35D851|nr:peroxiredoxin [Breoghania sp. L-A4]AXS40832.1 peroxiredoxin [Breoghania sp. L-A4]